MCETLIVIHSLVRWLVLTSLLLAIIRAYRGLRAGVGFGRFDNAVRHWTATFAHIQLMIGLVLYFQSPVIKYFWANAGRADMEYTFFGLIHIFLMFVAIIMITIGSAMAKRKTADREKFKTILTWFLIALLIIFIAIPWPFSPLASRQYFR